MSGGTIARRYWISGIVQGVGFRFFAQRAAEHLGLAGYARNLGDGRVEVYAIGGEEQLSAFGAQLQRGPRAASVSQMQEEAAEVQARYQGAFSIEYDA